jgi:predicted HTH transcriptional regulator
MPTLTNADILARLTAIEDSTVERKTISDNRDWVKAAVAYNDGRIQEHSSNFENLQRSISGELSNIYPPINPTILVREKEGKKFIAVVVYGSAERPHFAGKSYIRDGTQTREASEANIQEFIARRNSKAAEILKWKNQNVTMVFVQPERVRTSFNRVAESVEITVVDCNQHWLTFRRTGGTEATVTLRQVELRYDTEGGL